jgi:hypothetical protein
MALQGATRVCGRPSKLRQFYHRPTVCNFYGCIISPSLSAPHRLKDLADVQELIARLKLPPELAENLDASVRDEYRRLRQSVQDIQ